MSIIITTTLGLCIWIVLWALRVNGFDGILIAITMVLLVIIVSNVAPNLSRRRDR